MEKEIALHDLMVSKTTHETILSKIDSYIIGTRNLYHERRILENCRVDYDVVKTRLYHAANLQQKTEESKNLEAAEEKLSDQQDLFRTLLLNMKDLTDEQMGQFILYLLPIRAGLDTAWFFSYNFCQ